MTNEEIAGKVKEVIRDSLCCDLVAVTDGARFNEDLGADSLDEVELVMALEEEFDIEIPDEEAEKIKTVGEAVAWIQTNRKPA